MQILSNDHLIVYFLLKLNELFKYAKAYYDVALYFGSGFSNIKMNVRKDWDTSSLTGKDICFIRDLGGYNPLKGDL